MHIDDGPGGDLFRRLEQIDAIAEQIRKGHQRRCEMTADNSSRSLSSLVALLTQTQTYYRSHKKVFHQGV